MQDNTQPTSPPTSHPIENYPSLMALTPRQRSAIVFALEYRDRMRGGDDLHFYHILIADLAQIILDQPSVTQG